MHSHVFRLVQFLLTLELRQFAREQTDVLSARLSHLAKGLETQGT